MTPFQSIFKFVFSGLLLSSLLACGGGGGGGGASVIVAEISSSQLMSKYSGRTEAAQLTEDELYPVLSYLFKGDVTGLTAMKDKRLATLASIKTTFQTRNKAANSNNKVKQTIACVDGGKLTVTENMREPGLGQASYRYDQCVEGGITFSGSIFYDLLTWGEGEVGEFNIVYDNYTEQYVADYRTLTGTLAFTGGGSCLQTTTSNILLETNKVSTLDVDLKSQVFTCVENYGETPEQNISGQVYFSNMGYLNIKTETPIKLNEDKQLTAGKLRLSNALSSMTLETKTTYTYDKISLTTISANYNNDENIDREISVPSWYLMDTKYSDLADDDHDGLLNHWEIDHGLDETLSNENSDSDKDGFLDYYEYLANTDPLDIYTYPHFSIEFVSTFDPGYYVNETVEIPLTLKIENNDGLATLMKNTRLTMPLTPEHSWSVLDNASGCRILNNDERDQPVLSCNNINLSTTDYSETFSLATLQVTLNDATQIKLQAKLETDIPYNDDYLTLELTPNRSDLASRVQAASLGLVKDDIVDNIEYSFVVKADPQGRPVNATVNVFGKVTTNEAGIFINGVDSNDNYGVRCTFSDLDFSCYNISIYANSEFILGFTKPVDYGHLDLEFTTETIYTPDLSQSKKTTGSISIGQNMSALKAQIDATEENKITVIPGIYIGNIALDRELSLKGEDKVELWLTSNDGNGAFKSTQRLDFDGFDVYINNGSNFTIAEGIFSHNRFEIQPLTYLQYLVNSDKGLHFIANEVSQNETYGSSYLLKSAGRAFVANNLFVAPPLSNCKLWQSSYDIESGEYGSLNLINNTIVNLSSLVSFAVNTANGSNNLIINADASYCDNVLNGLSLTNSILPACLSETSGKGNIFTDNAGVDSANGYRLFSDSVAIDAGLNLSDQLTDDLEGNRRAVDGAFDIGAYEYQY
ncbi:choice-of-anchor Q domain-containing protein [Psychromonas antarctica]|uniref:choice-of-anchor Q domain-containing protein n=1 Tax=Psychromonas antarctica TaxID=67573 RepID=UPI001EE94C5A|nr:choice-of-anchor Q domain-containing protein [Psychromonas antarctica]MCG6200871.1 hypothetical protein [Psychromonas antarctica]